MKRPEDARLHPWPSPTKYAPGDDQTTRLAQGYGARVGFDLDEKDALSAQEVARRLVMEGRKGKLYELKPEKDLAVDQDDVWTHENVQEAAVEVVTQLMMSKVTHIDVVAQCFNCEFRAVCLIRDAHRYRLKLVNHLTEQYEYYKLNDRRLGKVVNTDRDMIYWGGHDKEWPWDLRMRYQNLEETADNTLKLNAALIQRPLPSNLMGHGVTRHGLTVDGFCEFDLSFKYRCQGSFTEQMNLQNYPFDSQRLCIRLILLRPYQLSSKSIEEHRLGEARFRVDDYARPSLCDPFNFAMDNQWNMLTYNQDRSYRQIRKRASAGISSPWTCVRMGTQLTTTHPKFDITPGLPNRQVFSKLKISLAIKRRTLHFVYEHILPMFFLTLLSATSFAIEPDSPDRLMVVTTFVLAVVLFNNGAMTYIPPISYTSWLGAYKLVCCEVPMALMMVQAVSVKAHEGLGVKDLDLEEFEWSTVVAWFVYFFVVNFGFAIWAMTIFFDKTPSFTGPSTTVNHRDYLEQLVAGGAPIPLEYNKGWETRICSECRRVPHRHLPEWRMNNDGRRLGWSKIKTDEEADICAVCR